MSRPNFIVKVPSIPIRPRTKKKLKRQSSRSSSENVFKLETIKETKNADTRKSSYYSIASEPNDSSILRVLETYDEFLHLKDLDKSIWDDSNIGLKFEKIRQAKSEDTIDEGMFILKQICTDLQFPLELLSPHKECQIKSLFQTTSARKSKYDIKTAIIAQRIMETQEQIEKSRGNSRIGFSKESLRQNSSNKGKSYSSMGTIEELPLISTLFDHTASKTPTNFPPKYGFRNRNKQTLDSDVQVDLTKQIREPCVTHSCNTQTEQSAQPNLSPKEAKSKIIQTTRKTKTQHVQSSIISCQDKFINTDSAYCLNQERYTQMYEHITENDLFCMEWIDKNLFRVPVNPNTVIVDERIKESSEHTCYGTSFIGQEMLWERQALCL